MAEIIKIMIKLVKDLNKNHNKSVRVLEISNIQSLRGPYICICCFHFTYT